MPNVVKPLFNKLLKSKLRELGFHGPHYITRGENGQIWTFTYRGNDPEILSLCVNDRIIIKVPFTDNPDALAEFKKEISHSNYLFKHKYHNHDHRLPKSLRRKEREAQKHIKTDPHYILQKGITLDDHILLLSKPIYHQPNAKHRKDRFKSLHDYIIDETTNRSDVSLDLAELAHKMKLSQENFHKKNIVHGDTALRNFLIDEEKNIFLCDFGLSCKRMTGEYVGNIKIPANLYDIRTLHTFNRTLQTDMFALKVSLIAMIGLRAGAINETKAIVNGANTLNLLLYREKLSPNPYQNANKTLQTYLTHCYRLISQSTLTANQKKDIFLFLEAFYPFLSKMPTVKHQTFISDAELKKLDELNTKKGMEITLKKEPFTETEEKELNALLTKPKSEFTSKEKHQRKRLLSKKNSTHDLVHNQYTQEDEATRKKLAIKDALLQLEEDKVNNAAYDNAREQYQQLLNLSDEEVSAIIKKWENKIQATQERILEKFKGRPSAYI